MVDPRHLRIGLGMFLGGVACAFISLLVATTGLGGVVGLDMYEARLAAGVMGGLAVPAVLLATLALFPATGRAWASSAIGAGIALLGVSLFWHAYPTDWAGYGQDLTALVSIVYAFGLVTMAWSLFTTVATFKRRNDPGGMVTLQVAPTTGIPPLVQLARAGLRHAGGWFDTSSSETPGAQVTRPAGPQSVSVTDGGDGDVLIGSPGGQRSMPDRHCGSCVHFTYGNDAQGKLSPYCRYHDEAMNDMEPCRDWQGGEPGS